MIIFNVPRINHEKRYKRRTCTHYFFVPNRMKSAKYLLTGIRYDLAYISNNSYVTLTKYAAKSSCLLKVDEQINQPLYFNCHTKRQKRSHGP
jgi:hypothetical protein